MHGNEIFYAWPLAIGQHITGLTDVWKIAKHCANDVSIKMMKTPYPGGTPLGAEVNISSYSGARGDCLIFFTCSYIQIREDLI